MDDVTNTIQDEVPWCMIFEVDIVLIDNSEGINEKLELWKTTLESKGLRKSRSKTEYMHCKFSQNTKSEIEVILDRIMVPKCKKLRYIGSLFQENGNTK